ncbi:hypothetical protein Bbelb_142770 [Branchiostoma belcheri]|nr:hypothetical protein Bbelb_142770 [Branchiostoma belcheri]
MLEEPGFLKIKDQCRSKDTMGRKLAHVLIFLLIILKEPNMPEAADCSCKPSPVCKCPGMGLTSIPQNLPTSIVVLDLKYNLITTVDQSLLLRVVSSTVCSIALIGGTIFVVWCKRRIGHPPLGLNPIVVGGITNTAISVMANVHDNQHEYINSNCDQTAQGRSQASTESKTNTTAAVLARGNDQTGQAQSPTILNLSRNKVPALNPDPMYADAETTPKSAGIVSSDDQTRQDQSHAITESYTNTTCVAMASGDDHHYKDVDNHRVQSQAITESMAARNLSYGTGSTASQLNSLYKTVEQLE